LPKISICIPAYKRPDNIRRLLQSIHEQTFHDYEVILSDDSPDDAVQKVCTDFPQLQLYYLKNEKSKGTPANWNFAISHASGTWIKLMHDDDWFSEKDSLQKFADKTNEGKPFIFCNYTRIWEDGKTEIMKFRPSWKIRIISNPMKLLSRNVIGPPSVIMVHNSVKEQYDTLMKWRVDIDFYIRLLKREHDFAFINESLVNVGFSESQVTNNCLNIPEVELPEGLLLFIKYGVAPLQSLDVYDAWWRILRNVKIRNLQQLETYTPGGEWPVVISKMIEHQSTIAPILLNFGPASKLFMLFSYLRNKKLLKN
jgi:glycosyltransferase involved in cell wall biosynthesis